MNKQLTKTQVDALISSVEFYAETFNGDIEGEYVDTLYKTKNFKDFGPVLGSFLTSLEENPFIGLQFNFAPKVRYNFHSDLLEGSSLQLYLDEEDSVTLDFVIFDNGMRMLTFSHGGLTLVNNLLWGRLHLTEFTTIRDNVLPNAAEIVSKMIDAFSVRSEIEKIKTFASLTWKKEGVSNKVLSDIKSICAFVDMAYPGAKAEEAAGSMLPNGLENTELLDVKIADFLCDTVSEAIEDEGASIYVVESEAHGFFGCSLSQAVAEWTVGKSKKDNLFVDVYSGTPVSDAALIIYSNERQMAHVELHANHYDSMHPLIYDVNGLINTITVAANGNITAEIHMLEDVIHITENFLDYFVFEGTMCEHQTQGLLRALNEYKNSLVDS